MVVIWSMMVDNGNIWGFPARHGGPPIAGLFIRAKAVNGMFIEKIPSRNGCWHGVALFFDTSNKHQNVKKNIYDRISGFKTRPFPEAVLIFIIMTNHYIHRRFSDTPKGYSPDKWTILGELTIHSPYFSHVSGVCPIRIRMNICHYNPCHASRKVNQSVDPV